MQQNLQSLRDLRDLRYVQDTATFLAQRCDKDRQLDILKTNGTFYTIPSYARPVLRGQDFINFNIPKGFPADRYVVAISTQDTSNGPRDTWRGISRLKSSVEWPWIHLAFGVEEPAGVMLLPDNESLPRFIAHMEGGSTYEIPNVNMNRPGLYQMERHGKWVH